MHVNIFFMYGINLQLFNSKLGISVFDNLPIKLHFAQLSQKIFPVLRKLRKKVAQNRAKLIAFNAQKFAKKNCAKIAQIFRKRFSHFVETLSLSLTHCAQITKFELITLHIQCTLQFSSVRRLVRFRLFTLNSA